MQYSVPWGHISCHTLPDYIIAYLADDEVVDIEQLRELLARKVALNTITKEAEIDTDTDTDTDTEEIEKTADTDTAQTHKHITNTTEEQTKRCDKNRQHWILTTQKEKSSITTTDKY